MPLPTLAKTWQFNVNNNVTLQGMDTALTTNQRLLWGIKNAFVTMPLNPWTVVSSSNSSVANSSDNWTAPGNLIWAGSGVPHSWIVLKQTGIASNYQVLIDCLGSTPGTITVAVSTSAGFTGGNTGTAPTATDTIIPLSSQAMAGPSGAALQCAFHVMQTTDGSSTRVLIANQGFLVGLWGFEKPAAAVTGWTIPSVAYVRGTGSLTSSTGTYTEFNDASRMNFRHGSVTAQAIMTSEGSVTSMIGEQLTVVPNDMTGEYELTPVGIFSTSVGARGRQGILPDLYWGPTNTFMNGTTLPTAGTRLWVKFGDLFFPWNGTVPEVA